MPRRISPSGFAAGASGRGGADRGWAMASSSEPPASSRHRQAAVVTNARPGAHVSDRFMLRPSVDVLLFLESHFLERCRPGIRVDEHQRRFLDPRPHAARPDVLPDRSEADALVDELLDLMQERLALLLVGDERLLLVERVDV